MDSDRNDENDGIDIWPFHKKKSISKLPKKDSNHTITIYGNVDSDKYSMEFPNMGKCLIFNHKNFDKLPERKGTEKDAQRLYCQFKKLGFEEVRIFNDFTVKEVMDKLKKVAKEDHDKNSCFICCILTHGNNGVLYAKDGMYPMDCLYDFFNGSFCPTLVGRPKIFFIQACQGKEAGSGVDVICKEPMESPDSGIKFKYPIHADFLIALSTFPGFVAFKSKSYGSYYMQYLCDTLEEDAQNTDLLTMLTTVHCKFAFNFESFNDKEPSIHMKKQVPCFISTLTKMFRFPQNTS